MIFTRRGVDIEKYPAIKRHLEKFREDLEPKKSESDQKGRKPGSYKWYEIQDNIAYYEEFERPKIVYNETSKELHAFVDYENFFIDKTGFIITSSDNEYILGIINSALFDVYYRHKFPAWGDALGSGRIQFRKDRMIMVPISPASESQKSQIVNRVRQILADPMGQDVGRLEAEIDRLVYRLYGLTGEEIAIVEREIGRK